MITKAVVYKNLVTIQDDYDNLIRDKEIVETRIAHNRELYDVYANMWKELLEAEEIGKRDSD